MGRVCPTDGPSCDERAIRACTMRSATVTPATGRTEGHGLQDPDPADDGEEGGRREQRRSGVPSLRALQGPPQGSAADRHRAGGHPRRDPGALLVLAGQHQRPVPSALWRLGRRHLHALPDQRRDRGAFVTDGLDSFDAAGSGRRRCRRRSRRPDRHPRRSHRCPVAATDSRAGPDPSHLAHADRSRQPSRSSVSPRSRTSGCAGVADCAGSTCRHPAGGA